MSPLSGLGSAPRIRVTNNHDKGIQVECTSAGWYPEPWVEWRDLRGQMMPAVTHFSVLDTSGLFTVVSSVVPQDGITEGLTCYISNPLLSESKVAESSWPSEYSVQFCSQNH
jgi:butyrophilin